jgi:hypothetical protein
MSTNFCFRILRPAGPPFGFVLNAKFRKPRGLTEIRAIYRSQIRQNFTGILCAPRTASAKAEARQCDNGGIYRRCRDAASVN